MMNNEDFQNFIKSISIDYIQPTSISFERFDSFPQENTDIQINWKMSYPEKPYTFIDDKFSMLPMFEIAFVYDNKVIFSNKSIFIVMLSIKNKDEFERYWSMEEIRKTFKDKQIRNTLWPIVRQQVLDGLSRLSLPPVALPWLL